MLESMKEAHKRRSSAAGNGDAESQAEGVCPTKQASSSSPSPSILLTRSGMVGMGINELTEHKTQMTLSTTETTIVEKILREANLIASSLSDLKFSREDDELRRLRKGRKSQEEYQHSLLKSNSGDGKADDSKFSYRSNSFNRFFQGGKYSKGVNNDDDCQNINFNSIMKQDYSQLGGDDQNDNGNDYDDEDDTHHDDDRDKDLHDDDEILAEASISSDETKRETLLLYYIFEKFSSPSPTFYCVRKMLELEQCRVNGEINICNSEQSIFEDVVINIGDSCVEENIIVDEISKSSLVARILESKVLMKLPIHFSLAFLRLLIRLLTGESDKDYDEATFCDLAVMEDSCKANNNKNDDKLQNKETMANQHTRNRSFSSGHSRINSASWMMYNHGLRHLHDRNKKRLQLSLNSLYSAVRFRCGERNGERVDAVLEMIESLLENSESERENRYILALCPLCRLLGILTSAGISPKQLRKIMNLLSDGSSRMGARALILRALIVGTEGSSATTKLRGKASPRSFFCVGRSSRFVQTLYPAKDQNHRINGWPFKTSFGMACWFRIEGFAPSFNDGVENKQILFKICSGDGTSFEISFQRLNSVNKGADSVAHIIYSVRDSERSRKEAQTQLSRHIEVMGFPIVPHVWFHIAVRHTRKSYITIPKDEVSFFLDGKLMMMEQMRFPISSTFIGDKNTARSQHTQPIEISFLSGIDAEAGALYVFDDSVSDDTLHALYEHTSGNTDINLKEVSPTGIFSPADKKVNANKLNPIIDEEETMVNMKKADADELVIPRDHRDSSTGIFSNLTALDLVGDDEYQNSSQNPTKGQFSRQAFMANIFLVWDPVRVLDGRYILEAHSGAHCILDEMNCVPWKMRGAKTMISCVGGVQSLLPVLKAMICPENFPGDCCQSDDFIESQVNLVFPLSFSLLTAFLRNEDLNGREWLRCGGTEILEYFVFESKKTFKDLHSTSQFWRHLHAFRTHRCVAEDLVGALVDLKEACAYHRCLESKLFSTLLLNVGLWLGDINQTPGNVLDEILLPSLSCLVMANPKTAAKSVNAMVMVNLIRGYSEICSEPLDSAVQIEILDIKQRDNLIDVIMGILYVVLSEEVNISNFSPLVQVISHNLDHDWETKHKEKRNMNTDFTRTGHQQNIATEKFCSLVMLLLQARPVVSGLLETMHHILGDCVSWILCCMVNSYDDKIRSIGVRCFTAFYDVALSGRSDHDESSSVPMMGAKRAVSKVSQTIKSVGEGLGVISKGFEVSTRSVNVGHKLLWHILKCHRFDLSSYSHDSLLELLFVDASDASGIGNMVDHLITQSQVNQHGYQLDFDFIRKNESLFHSPKLKVRSRHATNCIFQLLRFLPCMHQERLLFDLLTLVRINKAAVDDIIKARYWQHSLFHVASDTVEALSNFNNKKNELIDSSSHSSNRSGPSNQNGNNLYARFDLSFQLYASLLGHCLRADDEGIHALEMACSLQRVCVNGVSVFSILLSHVLNDLISNGTIIITPKEQLENMPCTDSNRLQDCATSFFKMDITNAAKHWKKLRNLTAVVTAVVTDNGYSLVDLFDYRNSLASIIDNNSGGIFGIRLNDRIQHAILATDVLAETRVARKRYDSDEKRQPMSTHYYRRICTTLSCQILDLLDPFIFFQSSGVLTSSPQQQGFALVLSIEPQLGTSQGPLIFSLVRLSLVVLSHVEPSSSKFLRSCNMLRCFLRWCLDMVHDPSSTATKVFHEDTAVNDRVIICIILQCHRSLSKCFSVLNEIELPEGNHVHVTERPRHVRRLYSVVSVLGDTIRDVHEARKKLLLEALTEKAYCALESSVLLTDEWINYAETSQHKRSKILRQFLESDWVTRFHDNDYFQTDVDGLVGIVIPEILNRSGENRIDRAVYIMKELAVESKKITEEYHRAIDSPFNKYLEDQRSWADTTAVRDLEYDGNCAINDLTSQFQYRLKTMATTLLLKYDIAYQRYSSIRTKIRTDSKYKHWKLARSTDQLHRRILLTPNLDFDDHMHAIYGRPSGLDNTAVLIETHPKKEEQLQTMLKVAKEGIVRRQDTEKSDGCEMTPNGDIDHGTESQDSSTDSVVEEENNELISEWDYLDDKLVLDKDPSRSFQWAKQYIWEPNERLLQYLKEVQIVTVQTVLNGELVLTTHSLYFRPIDDPQSAMTKESLRCPEKLEEERWRLNRLTDVHERRYMLRPQAIELFFVNAPELFINFNDGRKIRDKFVENLRRCKTPLVSIPKVLNPKAVFNRNFPLLTRHWQERKVSNFEYLMKLNILAGRTFNDVSQYPVFPWVIADYNSPELDLSDDRSFRDLTKPIGALNPQRLMQLLQRFHDLDGLPDEERFLYGSHYSSPGVVLHFLLRQEPFTSMAIELQSGRFDCPDRLFFDIAECWHSCMHSTSDVKELIPEMFTCPEIFLNTNNFQFGKTQKDVPVGDVKLPPWANSSPYEFVRLHKLALESEYVSNNLHHWIDLIFGYKQRGPESIKSNNVFHFLSYEGSVDLDKITDELNRKATEAHIQNFGQTPSQLLSTPHPARYADAKCWKPVVSEFSQNRLMSYTPIKQFGGKRNNSSHGPALSIEVLLDLVIVVYADLCVGTYKWAPTEHGKTPFLLQMDKIKPLASREISVTNFALEAHTNSIVRSTGQNHELIGYWSFAMAKDANMFSPISKDNVTKIFDATLLSCGYCDNSIKAHALDGLKLKCSKTGGHIGAITCLELVEECPILITGGEDATCRVWTVEQPDIGNALIDSYVKTSQDQSFNDILTCCLVLWGHNCPISCLAFDSDLDIVVSGSVDGCICIHTVRCGNFIRSFHTKGYTYPDSSPKIAEVAIAGVRKLALHKDGIFIAHLETGILQMRSVNGAELGCVDAGEKLNVMKMIPSGYSLVTGGESGRVLVRSLKNLAIKYALNINDYGPVHCIAFNPPSSSNEQFIFVGTQDGSITVVCAQR
mmetsp:Transcript_11727/g.21928  ORF Transcript_11727/g.21928 Transcript_11727/m.21928 type:complete len:2939 (+) Transcript_11727:68-8884(+)